MEGFLALAAGTKNWPNPSGGGAATIDDLWHAALNSRGRALSARDTVEYSAAIKAILDEMSAWEGNTAGIGVSTTPLPPVGSATKKYTPEFQAPKWVGNVKAQFINASGVVTGDAWSAASQLPGHASRKIFSYDPAATGTKGVAFQWASLSSDM